METQRQMRVMQKDLMEGADVDFADEKEYWNTYKLKDGTTLKIKLVLRGVKRLKKWSPDGLPVYVINSRNIVRVLDVPKKLKAKPKPNAFKPV